MTQHNILTVGDLQNQWMTYLHGQGRSPHTITAYRRSLEHFRLWMEQVYHTPFDLSAVMPRDVRDWKAYQQTTEKARPATVNQRLVAITRLFRWAITQGICRDNPAETVTGLRLPLPQPKALSPIELRRLLRAAKDHVRDFAVIEVLAGTGLRVGELLSLTVGDVVVNERSGKVIVRRGKHGGYREIPLTVDVRNALASYFKTLDTEHTTPATSLWQGTRGEVTHRSSVVRLLRKYAHLAQIPRVHPHQLRHTFATRYLAANPDDLRGLARLLGHANLNTVMIYTEPNMDDLRLRMERVESYVGV